MDYKELGLVPFGPEPNPRQMEWLERERTVFFHFGMNTFTDKEWGDGTEDPKWFNPTELCVDQWISVIKEAGFKAAILTAKHHDGFCLWPTKYTQHSIKNSPYKDGKGDIVKEFFDACEKYDIKAGIYLSPWDRHEKTWGSDEYNDFYAGQLTELLTGYGKLWELWWDGAGSTEAVYDWARWAEIVKKHQPDAVIFGSLGATPWVDVRWVGNESGIAGKPCYSRIEPISLVVETTSELNSGLIEGSRFIPAEVDVSIRPGWFFHESENDKVRDVDNLIGLWFTSNGSNAGLLLNLPPDRRGLIHENDVSSLLGFEKRLQKVLSENFAEGATVTSSSERDKCPAMGLVTGGIYAPEDKDKCPEIMVTLKEEATFNAVMLREEIGLGQRVTGYTVEGFIDGGWRLLTEGKCIGNRLCEKFDTVSCQRLRIKITEALNTPVLKELGLYLF
ncbi:MAG: alpha-L-fucosidase [Clostridia bacterium]|nr:alpha-L-fucosidase [Clostridia bacterium]